MRKHLPVLAVALYVVSMALPAIEVLDVPLFRGPLVHRTFWGIHCLGFGFLILPGWLANPLFVIAGVLMLSRAYVGATIVSLLAIASAIFALVLLAEPGSIELLHVRAGYGVWLASIVLMAIAAGWHAAVARRQSPSARSRIRTRGPSSRGSRRI